MLKITTNATRSAKNAVQTEKGDLLLYVWKTVVRGKEMKAFHYFTSCNSVPFNI